MNTDEVGLENLGKDKKESKSGRLKILGAGVLSILLLCLILFIYSCSGGEKTPKQNNPDLLVLKDAILLYKLDTGTWPDTVNDLSKCCQKGEFAGKPYVVGLLEDYWQREYRIFKNGKGRISVGSFGRDGLPEGEGVNSDMFLEVTFSKDH